MAGLIFREAAQTDHAALEAISAATPMGSRIRLCLERAPDFFAGSLVQAEEPCVRGFFDETGRAAGIFSAGRRRVWLNGEMSMRYLADLRIRSEFQGGSLLARGFHKLRRDVFAPGEWAQTLILEDNLKALALLQSRRAGLPEYRPAGHFLSWLIAPQRIASTTALQVRVATQADVPAMRMLLADSARSRSFADLADFSQLGGPRWRDLHIHDFRVAERRGNLCGMLGLWDQRGFSRIRIGGYPRVLALARPAWNALTRLSHHPSLPPTGSVIPILKATAVACADDDPSILRTLLSATLAEIHGPSLLVGFSAQDPLCQALQGVPALRSRGAHFLVGWDGRPPQWQEPFAFDVARI